MDRNRQNCAGGSTGKDRRMPAQLNCAWIVLLAADKRGLRESEKTFAQLVFLISLI
jgi:hypothetical protein